MQTLELNDGTKVEILGHVQLEGKNHFIVKLPSPKMINERLVSMVVYPIHYFKDTYVVGFQENPQ